MSNNSTATTGGTSTLTVLTLIFVVLKLVGVIDWSWWWVLSPTLIPLAFGLALLGIVLIVKVVRR